MKKYTYIKNAQVMAKVEKLKRLIQYIKDELNLTDTKLYTAIGITKDTLREYSTNPKNMRAEVYFFLIQLKGCADRGEKIAVNSDGSVINLTTGKCIKQV